MSDPTPTSRTLLLPGELWPQIQARTRHGLQCGALQSIPTHASTLADGGMAFVVRILDNLARKQRAKQKQTKATADGKPFNPFLPYDQDLFVGDLSETHLCLLNKYNVVDHHILVVTRAFESQERWLNQSDFHSIWRCLAEVDGLAFYNGGPVAGASQRHKHLQLIPTTVPVEAIMQFASQGPQTLPALPFRHSAIALSPAGHEDPAAYLLNAYHQLLEAAGVAVMGDKQTAAYNLLLTRRWMLVVLRSQEAFASISVNALGFAGSLFVRDEEQLQRLKSYGPMALLKQVAVV
ncbi:MAG: phosphorylase [Cyanobacteria bacterium P01_A01_bin.135]